MHSLKSFQGFSQEGIQFLSKLQKNNNREWFQENKALFKRELELPAQQFSAEMVNRISELLGVNVSSKIFRIYRDVRFSKDKTPYNTHLRISFIPDSGRKEGCGDVPAFYFSLEPKALILGAGTFSFAKEGLSQYQHQVDNQETGAQLVSILQELKSRDFYIEAEIYKRIPSGFAPDHPREELIRRKGLALFKQHKLSPEIESPKLIDFCVDVYATALPLYRWLLQINS